IVTAPILQLEHHLRQPPDGDDVPLLRVIVLADLIVLAVDAAQVALSEKDVASAPRAGESRLLAEVGRIGGDDRIFTRGAGGEDARQPVVAAIPRADRAGA